MEILRQHLEQKYGTSIYTSGYKVYSTIDLNMQHIAEKALSEGVKNIEKRRKPGVQAALVAIDIRTGQIKAMVGGFDFWQTQFNRATQALRQPGSAPANTSTPQSVQNGSSTSQLQSALEKIYFDFDSASLTESARKTLTSNAALLIKEPTAKVRIEGHCDERGSAEYNVALGEQRARAALQYLKTLGIKPDRLFTLSYGKEKPAVEGHDEAAMAKNRRDEFVVLAR